MSIIKGRAGKLVPDFDVEDDSHFLLSPNHSSTTQTQNMLHQVS
ncbi:hypothetical protein Poly59_25750 [Rubripirellula reticaptiva]|uniref:Uncharacterized protein n=1 Tax=Rubripirellula reticaptiva TaxID=2528013 RepID=A0A5C6F9T4_9BACT|nr:hypothetical protein Poly59_25750 [Rubripirellula reticaptiva]